MDQPTPGPSPDDESIVASLSGAHAGMTLRERLLAPDTYGLLLVMILGSTLIGAAVSRYRWGGMVSILMLGLTLFFALATSRASRGAFRTAAVVVPLMVVTMAVAAQRTTDLVHEALAAMALVLLVSVLVAILQRMATHPRITWATVLGGVCVYVLLGLVFSATFQLIGAFHHGAFFAQPGTPTSYDFLYFSLSTLTTVGYGDFTAGSQLGHMLAVSEAMIGQIYLVVAVGLLVGNMGKRREPRPSRRPGR
jgi:hypothetical protein